MTECPRAISDEQAVEIMRPAALKYAERLSRHDLSLKDDLIQEGLMGAMEAARTFDASRGLKFVSYASARVYGAMADHLRRLDFVSRVGRLKAAEEGREVAQVVSMEALGWTGGRSSDDRKTSFDRGRLRFDPAHHDPEPTDDTEAEFAAFLRVFCGGLSAEERAILRWYYVRDMPMREIGDRLGLSESRVSQVHSDVCGRLSRATAGRMRKVMALVGGKS